MVQLPSITMAHVYTEVSLFRGSLNYFKTVKVLFESEEHCPVDVYGFLVSHCLELALKAFLTKRGMSEKETIKIGHNLELAWETSHKYGLAISKKPEEWCRKINAAHNRPFYFRYAKTNTALVTPSKVEMYENLNNILDTVSAEIGVGRDGNVA